MINSDQFEPSGLGERPLNDDEIEVLCDITGLSPKNLASTLEVTASSCLLKQLVSYSELSNYIKPLYDALFQIKGINNNVEIDDHISSLRQCHYYESTAFIALMDNVKQLKLVPTFPSGKNSKQFSVDIWRLAHGNLVTPLTAAIIEHYQFEILLEQPSENPQIQQSIKSLSKCLQLQKQRKVELRSLGKVLVASYRNAFRSIHHSRKR
ncbi:hypothetical protein [Vibrio anguillarum]|uniref:Uncharacterized protein n=1 Tax=Vibrio anguillarum TaxID=55601 RepID=A0AAW4BJF7_VIBAN|nr:hypothetical protein [Vibrio anguillarum]MBF4374442.1 hypothetical protein [Vibrio anguillarum]MBF4436964.1 hypothetical protein [Vibrio anguillarum]